ncbi:regucalcin-like [Choristoneura fumiferana]|uniref:regucalcin-like n=1 Tax=Choristoneura fumiferana TaxID=7141 RepID=UPI003D156F59
MSIQIHKLTGPLAHGESPHWDARAQALYFVSAYEKTIHKYVLATGEHTKTQLDGNIGFLVPIEGKLSQFLVGVERKLLVVQWDGREGSEAAVVEQLGEVDQETPTNRLNDGKADPRGRVFAGTLSFESSSGLPEWGKASFYRIDGSGITKVHNKIGLSNGMAWDRAARAMYYIDSPERKVRRYDYDEETGEISNMRHICNVNDISGMEGFPDGMTIDTDGNLWVALCRSGCVLHVTPRGTLLRTLRLPATQVTSCTFGGPNYDILFVTSSRRLCKEGEETPADGCSFMITGLGVKGHPNMNFKLQTYS